MPNICEVMGHYRNGLSYGYKGSKYNLFLNLCGLMGSTAIKCGNDCPFKDNEDAWCHHRHDAPVDIETLDKTIDTLISAIARKEGINIDSWYYLTPILYFQFKPIVEEYLDKLEKGDFDDVNKVYLELTGKGIAPKQLKELLIELGYEDNGTDINGAACDYWIYLENPNRAGYARKLRIAGSAMGFSICLTSD